MSATETPARPYPAHDPATYRRLPASSRPVDPARVESLLAAEWERFAASTPASGEHNTRAARTLPLGVTSSFQHWDPYPVSVASARGAWLTDVDGRRMLDLSMGFGAMLVGHLNPTVVEHVQRALTDTGTLFVTPSPQATEMSERFCERFGLDMIRFTNSGTESLMYAIRAARAYTGRKAVVKIEGGYHGGYDALQVSVKPALEDIGPAEAPVPEVPFDVEAGTVHVVPTTTSTACARSSPSTAARSPSWSSSPSSRTSPSSSPTRATSPVSASCATSTASSCSSTR